MPINVQTNKFKQRDWRKGLFLGEQVRREGQVGGYKKCVACAEWFYWDSKHQEKYQQKGILEQDGKTVSPAACSKERCQRWVYESHALPNVHVMKRQQTMLNLFKRLKKKGLVA